MALEAFSELKLWLRIYDERVLTEDGIYAKDQVPTEYAGSELEIQFNQIMIFADSGGSFREFRVMDTKGVMDEDDNEGVGYTYELYGETITVAPTAPATHEMEWIVEETPDSGVNAEKMKQMYTRSLKQRGILPDTWVP